MKKADLCECSGWQNISDCQKCPEYDTCDICNRRVCKYVAVTTFHRGEPDDLICRPCAKEQGWDDHEIESQAIDLELLLSGNELHKYIDKAKAKP